MNSFILIVVMLIVFPSFASEYKWDYGSKKVADIDCDGKLDEMLVGYKETTFQIRVFPSSTMAPVALEFGLDQPGRQAALCGSKVTIRLYESDSESIKEEFGEVFKGYQSKPGCFDINLYGGECDSINIFWNHESKGLTWWRR